MHAAAAEPARAPASAACPASAAEKQEDDPHLLLLKLDDAALSHVVSLLDGWRSRARLRSACRRLRAAANGAVTELQAYARDRKAAELHQHGAQESSHRMAAESPRRSKKSMPSEPRLG